MAKTRGWGCVADLPHSRQRICPNLCQQGDPLTLVRAGARAYFPGRLHCSIDSGADPRSPSLSNNALSAHPRGMPWASSPTA